MQNMSKQNVALNAKKQFKQTAAVPVTVFLAAIGLTLVAIFGLRSWAEASELHHAVQHVLIFSAGAGAGSSLFSLFKTKKEGRS